MAKEKRVQQEINTKGLRIVRFEGERIKRLKAARIEPGDGNIVKIQGGNDVGKSSILDLIRMTIMRKSRDAKEVVTRGERNGLGRLDLGPITVERTWDAEENTTDVKITINADGTTIDRPRDFLDRLSGVANGDNIAFDPYAASRWDGEKQLKLLRELSGVNTEELDQRYDKLFEQRTAVGRDLDAARHRLSEVPVVNAPDEEVSIQALLERRRTLTNQQLANDRTRANEEQWGQKVMDQERRVKRLEEELAAAQRDLTVTRKAHEEAQDKAMGLVDPDLAPIDRELADAEATNKMVAAKKRRRSLEGEVHQQDQRYDQQTQELARIDRDRTALIAQAKFPIAGLGFARRGITYQGFPMEDLGDAKRLRCWIAMGAAKYPDLHVMCIHDGSLLDDESMKAIEEEAERFDLQIWIESVADKRRPAEPDAWEIQDGEVKRAPAGAPKQGLLGPPGPGLLNGGGR